MRGITPVPAMPPLKMLEERNWEYVCWVVRQLGVLRHAVLVVAKDSTRLTASENRLSSRAVPMPGARKPLTEKLTFLRPKRINSVLPTLSQTLLPLKMLPLCLCNSSIRNLCFELLDPSPA